MKNDFSEMLDRVKSKLVNLIKRTEDARTVYDIGDLPSAYDAALRLEQSAEKLVLMTRSLPAFTGNPRAVSDVNVIIAGTVITEIGFTPQGWFYVTIPALLPKKGGGSADYIRSFLFPAMREFFMGKAPIRYRDCVLIYRHIYDRDRPVRRRRDHDNIEINMVTDIVAMYVLPDDNPDVCSLYQTSAEGDKDMTEVYVVPRREFPEWLKEKGEMGAK